MYLSFRRFRESEWFEPFLASVFIHAAILLFLAFVRLQHTDETAKPNDLLSFHLKGGSANPYTSRKVFAGKEGPNFHPKVGGEALSDAVKLMKNPASDLAFERPASADQVAVEVPAPKMHQATALPDPKLEKELLDTETKAAKKEGQVKRKSSAAFYQQKAEANARMGAVTGAGLLKVLSKPLDRMRFYSPSNVSLDPDEGMPGFTPSHGEPGGQGPGQGTGEGTGQGPWSGPGQGTSNFEFDQGPGESLGDIVKYESLDNFLDIDVYTYQDPKDSKKYFMIKIFAKKGSRAFKVMPKEILFAVDASLSISADRLQEFKEGISFCLKNLNPQDTFNIVAFKDKPIFFAPQSVQATTETIQMAERFVSSLTSNQRTDVYAAFKGIIERPLQQRPSSVILISDGRPTQGVQDSRELISAITRINKRARPIFAFSGGARVNRYLLDFVAYQNRGWSEYIKSTSQIDKGLGGFYEKIKDPIFLDLKYRLNNLEEKDVYPRSLPDFYKGAEFTLYGTYEGQDQFSMQLLGSVEGQTKELVFTRALSEAKPGTADIMKGYAFNKIYHLISQLTAKGSDPSLLSEIDGLSSRYGVTTPYSPELQKAD